MYWERRPLVWEGEAVWYRWALSLYDRKQPAAISRASSAVVDAHTHVFCWGENPGDGFMSDVTQRTLLTRLLVWITKLKREPHESSEIVESNFSTRHSPLYLTDMH